MNIPSVGTPCANCGESDDSHGCEVDSFCCPGEHDRGETDETPVETSENELK